MPGAAEFMSRCERVKVRPERFAGPDGFYLLPRPAVETGGYFGRLFLRLARTSIDRARRGAGRNSGAASARGRDVQPAIRRRSDRAQLNAIRARKRETITNTRQS